jgi:UDP-N-acetylglucosamine enolpyruvyl transferase
MPSLADFEMDLRKLGPASDVEVNDTSRDGKFQVKVPQGDYIGEQSLESLQYAYNIVGAEVDGSDLILYLDENSTTEVHVTSI